MSDVDRLMATVTGSDKPVVNFDPYSDWVETQEKEKEPVDLRKGYADYLRETYIKAEAYDPKVEDEIQTGLYGSLVKDGVLKEGDLESYQSITASPELGLEEKANLFVNTFEIDEDEDSEWRTVSRYLTHAKQTAAGELVETEENTALLEQRRQAAEAIVARREDEMKRMAVDNGELAFASVLNEKGQRVVIAGDRALETDFLSGLKQSKLGGVSLADAAMAQSELEVPTGFNLPRFKLRRVHEAATGLDELAKKDAFLRTQIAGHAKAMAHAEHDKTDRLEWVLDEFGQAATDIFGRLLNIKGYEEARIEREKQDLAADAPISAVVRSLTKRLNSVEGNNYTQDEVMKAYTQVVLNDANQNGRFEFHDGDDEVGKNIRTFGYGAPVVHPAAMANEEVFNKMLDARPDIDDSVKENLRANRKAFLTESFESTDELLGRSGVADEWHTALMEGRQQGKKNYEILNDFLADEKNFSAWSERAKGVAWSLWDAGAQLVAAVPAAFKAEWAQDVLVNSAQRNSDRRQVAQLFGQDFGFGQDIAETIAPMVTDVAATALLAAATSKAGGVGAAAYLAGKQGARITAKGLIKGLTTSVFREVGTEGAEAAAKNLVLQGLIKESATDLSGAGSLAAIKAFNGAVAQKIGTTSAVFIPAATRSGGATYGSVFHTLSQDPSLSKEEIHDRALGAALGAGALTGLITATFSAFGRGGVEDALLKGMSYKQAKALIGSLASTEGITDATFKKVVAEQMKAAVKKFQFSTTKGLVKDAFDEAQEEGLDQLLNSFVEDAALHQNTPMLERIQQSFHAAALGGVMGAGATGIRQIGQRIAPNQMERVAQAAQLQQQFVTDVAARLEEVGSPMTAQAVAALLTSKARRRGQYAPPTDDAGGAEGVIAPEPTPQPQDDDGGAAAVEVPTTPELSDDALAAIQTREEKIAELNITPTGRKNAKRAAKQKRQASRLQQEIDYIKRTGELEVPANLEPVPAPAATQAQPTVPPPTSQPVEETPKTIVDRIQRLPAIDARARVQQAIENMTSDDLFDRQIDMSGVSTEAEGRYAKFSTLFPPAVVEAAESVGINPIAAAQNEAKHVSFFTPEETLDIEPDPKRVGYTFVPDTERRKAFAIGKKVEFDLKPFREGETAQEEELAEALSAVQVAQQGYPVRFSSGIKYGSAVSNKNMAAKSDFVADVVYSYFPTIELNPEQIAETRASSRKRTFVDPTSGKRVTRAIKMPLDENGVGLFTNDPVVVAEMLAHNIPVRVPYGTKDINPAIKPYIKRGYVTDVRMLSKDGAMLESAVVRIEQTTDLKPNNKRFEDIAGVQFIGPSPMQGEVESMLLAHSRLGQERNLPDPIGQLFSKQKLELDDEFATYTTQSSATEFLMLTHLFELRKTLLKPSRRLTVPAPNNRVTVNPSKKKRVIEELSARLSGAPDLAGTAKMVTPLLNLTSSAKPTHTDAVIQFIDDFVLNNPDFDGNVMPTFDSVFERTFNRYAQQQRERGINERNKAMVSIDAEATSMSLVDAQQLAAFSEDIGGIDPEDSVVGPTYFNAVVNSVDMAIDAVDTDPMLRDALNDLALKSVYTNPDSGTVNHVQQMSSRDLMSRIGLWMAAGDHATRTDALEFTQMLEEGGFRSGIDLRNALKLTSLFGRIDGDPSADPQVVSELRRQMTESLGEPVSEARAKNFLRAMDGAMRRRLSRAAVSTVLGQDALVHNTSEVARLGLVSGDSDSVIAAIEKIKKSSKNKSHRLVAELLLEDKRFISKVGFSMGISKADIAGEYVRHVNGKHSVFINMQKSNGIGLENVLLEEYVHAFLSDTLTKPEETLNSRQVLARRRLQGLYQMAQQEYRRTADTNTDDFNATLEAGLENMDEFVANFLLDPDFQKFIKTLDTPKGQRGFFARILDAMVSLFRKISPKENALYAAALKDVVDLSKSTMRASAVPFKQQAASAVHEASNRIQEAGRVMTLRTSVMPATPTTDADYMAAVKSGNMDKAQAMVDQAAKAAGLEILYHGTSDKNGIYQSGRLIPDAEDSVYLTTDAKGAGYGSEVVRLAVPKNKLLLDDEFPDGRKDYRIEVGYGGSLVVKAADPVTRDDAGNVIPLSQRFDVRQDSILYTSIPEAGSTQLITESQKDLTTEQQQAEFLEVIDFLRGRLPYGLRFKYDPNMQAAMGADGDFILINPKILMRSLESFDQLGKRKMVDIMLHEEIGHEASFGALTQAEIDGLVDSLSDEQYAEIASQYYRFSPEQKQQALANLQSENPAVVAEEKFRLAEEKLRMRLQEVTRGYTTEEDAEFWKSKPSLMAILKRYIGGVINKWVANRRLNGASGAMDVALTKVMREMQAIQVGFARIPLSKTFNPDAPADVVAEYQRALNFDPITDIENHVEAANQIALFAATAIDAEAFNRIMNYAGLEMELLARRIKKRPMDVDSMTDAERETFLEEEQAALELEMAGLADADLADLDPDLDRFNLEGEEVDEQYMATDDEIFGPIPDGKPVSFDKIKDIIENIKAGEGRSFEVVEGVRDEYGSDAGLKVDIALKGPDGGKLQSVDIVLKDDGSIKIGMMETEGGRGSGRMGASFAEALLTSLIVNNHQIGATRITTHAAGGSSTFRKRSAYLYMLNKFVVPTTNQEGAPSVQLAAMRELAPTDSAMNGYYSWPAYGFEIKSMFGAKPDFIFSENHFRSIRQSLLSAINEVDGNLDIYASLAGEVEFADDTERADFESVTMISKAEMLKILEEKAKADLAELRAMVTTPDGKIDLFYGLHDDSKSPKERKRAAYLWQTYGVESNVEFNLSPYSANLAAFMQRRFGSITAIKQIPELTSIVEEFETARIKLKEETDNDSMPDAYRDLQDEYNARVIDQGILDFPVFTSIGQNAGESSSLDGVDFSSVVQLLEMPMYEYQAYKAPKGWLSRLFMGDVGRPIKQLIDQRDAFNRASSRLVKQYKEKMDKLIVEAYGDPTDADWELIAQAQGYVDGSLLDQDALQKFDDEHMARIDKINQNDQLTPREKQIMRDSSRAKRDKDIETAEDRAIEQAERAADAALTKLGQRSSELAAHIQSMRRDLIQPIQQKLKAAGLSDQIAAKIDRTGGIYITRAYRMFNDPTFAERMRTDPQYADLRNEAMKFFEDELYKNTYNSTYSQTYSRLVDEGVDAGLAKAEAEAKATKKAKKVLRKAHDKAGRGSTAGAAALEAFLDKYSERTGPSPQSAKGLKVLENNLKKRKDVPEVIRRLLGEYGPREGTDLIVRTFATVANVAAQQTFLNNVAEVGKQQGFLVDQATYEAARDQYEDYVPLRKGNSTNPNDPLNNLYGPRDMVEAMQDTLNPSFAIDHNSTSEKAVRGLTVIAQKLTGQAMAMKTLGSVGFFMRNALGNFLFFGPAQGFFRVDKMMGRSLMFKRTSLNAEGQRLTDAQVQEYLTELTGLNIIGDELHAGLLRQLLNGEIDPESALAKVEKAIDEIPVLGKTKQGAIALQNKLAALSAAIDGRYKIAYYENELSILLEAKRRYPDSDIGRMSEYDLKRMAAEKVLMTAQSLSQAPPLAQALTKSGFGMVFAPFIRFKMEVPRIVINTYKLAARERKSDNPMIRARGTRRFFAMTGVLGGFSAAVPATLAALSGIGDEEDEALRKSMPEYLRGHTFFYLRDDKGNLRSVNMTYLNPFSLVVDPFLRSLPKLAKGDVSDAVGQFTKGMIFDTYFDDQILAGSMMDVLKNRNSTTDDPIWIEGVDGIGTSLQKSLTYLYENSYQPRLLKDMIDAKNATGGDYEGFANSPLGQLLDGAYPVKVHEVDLEKQYRRFIYSHLDRMSAVNKQKYELYSKESFDPDKIDAVYQRELDGKRALNQEMLRVARGFEGLGIAATKQFKLLTERGVGKNRARLLFHGVMDRPEINKKFAAGLVERGYASRLNELLKSRDKRARYLKIE